MPDILVRNVSPETAKALKRQAKDQGVSLAALARKALDDAAASERRRAALARTDAVRADMAKIWNGPSVLEMLREDRDGG